MSRAKKKKTALDLVLVETINDARRAYPQTHLRESDRYIWRTQRDALVMMLRDVLDPLLAKSDGNLQTVIDELTADELTADGRGWAPPICRAADLARLLKNARRELKTLLQGAADVIGNTYVMDGYNADTADANPNYLPNAARAEVRRLTEMFQSARTPKRFSKLLRKGRTNT